MTDKEKLEKLKDLADAMYYAAQYLTTDASRLRKTMEDYHQFIIHELHKKESVSELEGVVDDYTRKVLEKTNFLIGNRPVGEEISKAVKFGAKWQKEKMIANAIDVEVKVDAGGYPYIDRTIELYDYDKDKPLAAEGDKVKVIVIKEDV